MNDDQIKHMVSRFLSWKLPENFNPDNGISAKRPNYGDGVAWEPMGTNLLDYTQAEAMVRHMLDGLDHFARHRIQSEGRTGAGEAFQARPADGGAWEVWDVEHPAPCNHFPVLRVDSKGASDDLHESYARICAAALRARITERTKHG